MPQRSPATPAGSVVLVAVLLAPADGGSTSLDERVRPEDPANGDRFGIAVDLEGSRLVVGDPWWDRTRSGLEGDVDVGVEDEGAAFVFEQDEQGWGQTARLQVPEGDPEAELGTAVAFSRTTVLAGAPDDRVHHSPRAGSAYVFERCPTADPGAPSASALGTPPCTITSEGSPTAVAGT